MASFPYPSVPPKTQINCFGQNIKCLPEGGLLTPPIPYQFKTINDVAYCRFNDRDITAVQRMRKTGDEDLVTQDWAYGSWADCENLEYHPINEIIEV